MAVCDAVCEGVQPSLLARFGSVAVHAMCNQRNHFDITSKAVPVHRPIPAPVMTAPSDHETMILAIDVSLAMAATDVAPNRLAAAQAAAMAFVRSQRRDVRIGIVAFGGHADVVQPRTLNRGKVIAALEGLQWRQYTRLGNGLMGALL